MAKIINFQERVAQGDIEVEELEFEGKGIIDLNEERIWRGSVRDLVLKSLGSLIPGQRKRLPIGAKASPEGRYTLERRKRELEKMLSDNYTLEIVPQGVFGDYLGLEAELKSSKDFPKILNLDDYRNAQ
jgi:hypothetical protein